ncbi:MAG: hemerythrin domain-containing protein [Phycisphaeraceae bacterium]
MSLRDLIDHIVSTHHAMLRLQMPRALKLLEESGAHRSPRSATLAALGDVLRPMWQEMKAHIVREEQVVFPAIVLLDHARSRPGIHDGKIDEVIEDLDHDHELARDAQKLIRDLTNGFEKPPDADQAYCTLMNTLASLDADLSEHTRLEDQVLFPKARQAEAEWVRCR